MAIPLGYTSGSQQLVGPSDSASVSICNCYDLCGPMSYEVYDAEEKVLNASWLNLDYTKL